MNSVGILEDSLEILGEKHLKNLKRWYTDIIQSECRYLVFMVRRCYNVAIILEKLTGEKMEDTVDKEILTDSSFFLRCGEMAEFYKNNGFFPSVILCDDTLIHGRSLNSFIKSLELQFYVLLPDVAKEEIDEQLVRAIQINVYARIDKALLLNNKYEMRLRKQCILSSRELHWLSYALSSLILRLNVSNISYTFSGVIDEEQYNRISKEDAVKTSYQNLSQDAWIHFIGREDEKKGIATIRIIADQQHAGYRIIPLILLPNLDHDETDAILQKIKSKLLNNNLDKQYIDWLDKLENYPGKRMMNEFITFIFSHSYLRMFIEKNEIKCDDDAWSEELYKLVRNYNCFGAERTYALLKYFVDENVISWEECESLINEIVSEQRRIIHTHEEGRKELLPLEKARIKAYLEDKFYKIGALQEKSAYEATTNFQKYVEEKENRQVYGNGFMLRRLLEGYDVIAARYSISLFLHMLDLGILSLSSHASNDILVVGFSQFAKAGEQSQLIWPLRVYEWIPLMTSIEQECEWLQKDFRKEIEEFANSEDAYLEADTVKKIICFKELLEERGENSDDWYYKAFLRKELDDDLGQSRDVKIIKFVNRQQFHVDCYNEFKRKRKVK